MERSEAGKKVMKVVADVFGASPKKLKESTRFVDDLHAKSMEIVELLAALELEFGFRVPQKDVRQNKTIRQAIDYMHRQSKKFRK